MPSEKRRRRRTIASCTQCYFKKQKCDRKYPCGNCLRRRQPELCAYASSADSSSSSNNSLIKSENPNQIEAELFDDPSNLPGGGASPWLGYFVETGANVLSLIQQESEATEIDGTPATVIEDIKVAIQLLPKRFMMDKLVQHYITELNWLYVVLHPPTFLARYERWWKEVPGSSLETLEFCVLILRVCAFAAHFSSFSADGLFGIPQSTVHEHCHRLACRLSDAVRQIQCQKCIYTVQELFLAASYLKNIGHGKESWVAIGNAIHVAQDLRMHRPPPTSSSMHMSEFDKEMQRRTFCNLYLFDRFISAVLDRLPRIPAEACPMPKLKLVSDADEPGMPDAFQERILQLSLVNHFYSMLSINSYEKTPYDPAQAEDFFEKLRNEFILTLPPAYSLNEPERKWDKRMPALPRQRLCLRTDTFYGLCQLFRPLLKISAKEIWVMPAYKRNLLLPQRDKLVHAAFTLINDTKEIHQLMGGHKVALFYLVYYIFEGAITLALHLFTYETTLRALSAAQAQEQPDIFSVSIGKTHSNLRPSSFANASDVTRCRAEIEGALERLVFFTEVSALARSAARSLKAALEQLDSLQKTSSTDSFSVTEASSQNESPGQIQPDGTEQILDTNISWTGFDFDTDDATDLDSIFDYTAFLNSTHIDGGLAW